MAIDQEIGDNWRLSGENAGDIIGNYITIVKFATPSWLANYTVAECWSLMESNQI